MATTPDANPDSIPTGQPDDVEQVSPAGDRRDGDAETPDSVPDSPGTDGGTSGTGGTNHRQDHDVTS